MSTVGHIHIVDGDEFSRNLTAELLASNGHEVSCWPDGVSAVSAAEATPPDLILLDLEVPNMDGFQVLQVLRQSQSCAPVPVLVLSGLRGEEILLRCLRLGADNVLFKPVSHEELLAWIENLLVRKRRYDRLANVIRRHLDPSVAYQIMKSPDQSLDMCRVHLAVLFSDLRGFTRVAESLEPEQTALLLNSLFEELVGCVVRYGGTLDKFLGDGLMALFGAPINYPDNENRAVCAALDMLQAIKKLDQSFVPLTGEPVHMGIGISAGEAVVGPLGSTARRNYTAIGDTVNVAARLTALALGREIIISHSVQERLDAQFRVKALEPTLLKGKSQPLAIYRVLPEQTVQVVLRRKI
ncbi:MAG: response regulator [Deltaproteobacteria bacterium]|nr:response regulator [Deltaproteobacteria bacterium]